MRKPARPQPPERILDYDDGDPYSCIAAGSQEDKLQRQFQARVEACYGKPEQDFARLAKEDLAGVKTALYHVWERERQSGARELADWAAERMGQLGNRSLIEYDRFQTPG